MLTKQPMDEKTAGTAESAFREAFERLKDNRPIRLTKGTPVSQNNVAKEAGCDPSALRKSRYPVLITDIQTWVAAAADKPKPSKRQKKLANKKKRREQSELIADLKLQRDRMASLLVEADAKILELTLELSELGSSSNITRIADVRKVRG